MNMNDVTEKSQIVKTLSFITEVALIAYIGSMIGSYVESKTVLLDCQSVGIAKVGSSYIQCSPLETKKPAIATQPQQITPTAQTAVTK